MYQRVKNYIKEQKMLKSEDRVIVGISGGADSICLLFVLLKLQKEMGFSLFAVHVNHGLRGEDADADEAYVKQICQQQGVELFVFHEDVKAYAKEKHLSEEEAGRELRRADFLKVFEERQGTCIALAHHQDDNAETVLWNLCRGSGLRGLGGILPKNGIWIRPLLCVTRREIESYLENRGISYCTDATNFANDYTRNKIRNQVIPYLEAEIHQGAAKHIAKSANELQKIGKFIERETEKYRKQCVKKENGIWILQGEDFLQVPEELKSYIIYECICAAAGRKKDVSDVHVQDVQRLLEKQSGKRVDLPYGICAVRTYEGIEFRPDTEDKSFGEEDPEKLFELRTFEKCTELQTFPENVYTKWFDYDIIQSTVKIRHRQAGDYIVIDDAGRRQKLKQYFINEKIPQSMRDHIWLVADGSEIMWIVGYRQSQAYQISQDTKNILEIKFYGGKEDGRNS